MTLSVTSGTKTGLGKVFGIGSLIGWGKFFGKPVSIGTKIGGFFDKPISIGSLIVCGKFFDVSSLFIGKTSASGICTFGVILNPVELNISLYFSEKKWISPKFSSRYIPMSELIV